MNRVIKCISKGLLVPSFLGRGGGEGVWGRASPEKCEISKPLKQCAFRYSKLTIEEGIFYSKKVAFIQSNVAQSIPTSNEQMMKTR